MKITRLDIITKTHLLISIVIIVPVSILYGFYPSSELDIHPNTIDEYNLLKAIMGLYLSFALFWLYAILNRHYLKTAIITNFVFMLGLGFGRVVSILIDGVPTFGYLFGTLLELAIGIYGCWVINEKSINFA